jgi:hypothetical protein
MHPGTSLPRMTKRILRELFVNALGENKCVGLVALFILSFGLFKMIRVAVHVTTITQ